MDINDDDDDDDERSEEEETVINSCDGEYWYVMLSLEVVSMENFPWKPWKIHGKCFSIPLPCFHGIPCFILSRYVHDKYVRKYCVVPQGI